MDKVYSETLRDVMEYGTRYRIKRIFTLNIARKCLNIHFWIHYLDTFIQKLVSKYYLPASILEECKHCILKDLSKEIEINSESFSRMFQCFMIMN